MEIIPVSTLLTGTYTWLHFHKISLVVPCFKLGCFVHKVFFLMFWKTKMGNGKKKLKCNTSSNWWFQIWICPWTKQKNYDKFKISKLFFIVHQWRESLPSNIASPFQGWFGTIPPNNVLKMVLGSDFRFKKEAC
jgi:hypothetical protein